jgi:hypothetical protein
VSSSHRGHVGTPASSWAIHAVVCSAKAAIATPATRATVGLTASRSEVTSVLHSIAGDDDANHTVASVSGIQMRTSNPCRGVEANSIRLRTPLCAHACLAVRSPPLRLLSRVHRRTCAARGRGRRAETSRRSGVRSRACACSSGLPARSGTEHGHGPDRACTRRTVLIRPSRALWGAVIRSA